MPEEARPALTLRLHAGSARWVLLAGAGALVAVVALAAMGPGASVFLAGCLVVGTGLTYVSGLDLTVEERIAFGSIVGAMAVTGAGFLVALVTGFGAASVWAGLAVAVVAAIPGWSAARTRLAPDLAEAASRWRSGAVWPLWILLAVAWPFTLLVLSRAYVYTGAGLEVWSIGVYSDWAAHLTYAGSFAYGHNFPPQYPIDPGHRLGYPFMVDFFAASLVPLGVSLTSALVLTSGYLGLALPAVLVLAGARLVGSIAGAAVGVVVLAFGGGLGFVGLLGDVDRYGAAALLHPVRLYTQDAAQNLQWLNPVLAYLLPQRSILFGIAIAFIVAAALLAARRSDTGWRGYVAAGVLAGAAPVFHVHGFGTAVAVAAAWALLDRRREWIAFFVPALVIGIPVVLWLVQPGAGRIAWQPGWLAAADGAHDNWLWFWIKNTGVFIPLLVVAQFARAAVAADLRLRFAPLWLWFVAPNLFVFQPWDWDNTKFFVFWYAFGAMLVGALLVYLARRSVEGRTLAVALAAVLCLSGGLDLVRAFDSTQSRTLFTDAAGLDVAAWVRGNTPANAVFAVAPDHNEPVPTLGGRTVLAGYPGWLWTYGLPDWTDRVDEEKAVLAGQTDARSVGVDYVVIGPAEVAAGANQAYWQSHASRVYSARGYTVYRVR